MGDKANMIAINSTTINTSPSYLFTSVINVYAGFRVNVGITMGSITTAGVITSGGSFTGTVRLQRCFDNDTFWRDVATWTAATESITDKPEPEQVRYRLGCYNADHTAGEVVLRLGCGKV